MAKVTLDDLTTGHANIDDINRNNATIETAFDNTLSRDGTAPNSMSGDLDLGNNKIINAAAGTAAADFVTVAQLQAASVATDFPTQTGHSGEFATTDGSVVSWAALPTSTAAGTTNTPAGNIAATDVQAAINELDTEKAIDADVEKIANKDAANGYAGLSAVGKLAVAQMPAGTLTGSFTTSNITLTAGAGGAQAHSLGSTPSLMQYHIVCTDAGGDAGYAQNDEVTWFGFPSGGGGSSANIAVWVDATNVNYRLASLFSTDLPHKTTGTSTTITLSKWKLVIRVWV